MTLILSLLGKEFLLKPRDRWFHVKRLLYVVTGGVIILAVFAHQWNAQSNKAGLVMFEWLSLLVVSSAFLVSPYMAAAGIVQEKEKGTLNLLLLSDISVGQLIGGKLALSCLSTCLVVSSTIPLFILCVSLGGIDIVQVLLAFPILLTTVFAGACLGLFLACFLEREVRMQGYVALAAVLFFIILPGSVYLVCHALGWGSKEVLIVVSPGAAMYTVKQAEHFHLAAWNCLFNLLIGLPFLPLSMYLLPRLHVNPGGLAGWLLGWRQRLGLSPRARRRSKPPEITGNPVTWKDLHVHYGGEHGAWLKAVLAGVGISLLVFFVYVLVCSLDLGVVFSLLTLWWLVLLFLSLLCGINYLYGTLSRAAQCLSREKQAQTLAVLQTTDVSGYSIVMGKSNAISLALLPWIVGFACASVAFLFFSLLGSKLTIVQILVVAAIMLNLICMVYAYEYIAIYISLRMERYATAAALAGFMAWYVAGNLVLALAAALLIPFTFYLSILAVPVAGPVIIGNHFRLRLIREFPKITTNGNGTGAGAG